ncbi:MAG: alpha/beta fold hydrolase [Solirubrobacterales bacterium]
MSRSSVPLILLHGFAQTPQSWQSTIECLPEWLDVHAIELPGHGQTGLSRGEPTVQLAREIVDEAVDRVAGAAAIWGYSQGARIAFDYTLHRPDKVTALIAESGIPGIEDPIKRANRRSGDYALATRIADGSIEEFVDMWEKLPALGEQSKSTIAAQREDRLRNDPKALSAALIGIGQSAYEPAWDRLHEITAPTLLITGGRDAIYTQHAKRLQKSIPRAKHVVVDAASHAVHMVEPEDAAEAVAAFLADFA